MQEATRDVRDQPVMPGRAGGFVETSIGQMFQLANHEARTIAIAAALTHAVRILREESESSQAALAEQLRVPVDVIVEVERPDTESSLDILIPAFFAVGGSTFMLVTIIEASEQAV